MRALVSFFFLPFWVFFIGAVGIGVGTEFLVQTELKTSADKAIAREQPMPAAIDLSVFDKKADKGLVDEVHIQGWINTDYNKHLIEKENGSIKSERYLMVLFGQDDTGASTQAKAALVMTESERERFVEKLTDHATSYGPNGLVFSLNGKARSSETQSRQAKSAMRKDGLSLAPNFIFIDPYWQGRQVAFAPRPEKIGELRKFGYAFAAFFALIGLIKWAMRAARKPKRNPYNDEYIDSPIVSASDPRPKRQPAPIAASQPAQAFAADSPLGRMNMHRQEQLRNEMSLAHMAPERQKKPTPAARPWDRLANLPMWLKAVIAIVVLQFVLPVNMIGFLMPILMIAGVFYGYKKLNETMEQGAIGLWNMINPKRATPEGAKGQSDEFKNNPFARLH